MYKDLFIRIHEIYLRRSYFRSTLLSIIKSGQFIIKVCMIFIRTSRPPKAARILLRGDKLLPRLEVPDYSYEATTCYLVTKGYAAITLLRGNKLWPRTDIYIAHVRLYILLLDHNIHTSRPFIITITRPHGGLSGFVVAEGLGPIRGNVGLRPPSRKALRSMSPSAP